MKKSKEERDNEYLDMANIEQRKIEAFREKISNSSGIKEDVQLNELITNDRSLFGKRLEVKMVCTKTFQSLRSIGIIRLLEYMD